MITLLKSHSAWTTIDGRGAKEAADDGDFVVAGLSGAKIDLPKAHGHVIVIVSGPLADSAYPTAYWGTLGGGGERKIPINWSWRRADRDNVGCFKSPIA